MEIKEIKNKTRPELNHLLSEARKKFDDLRFKAAQNQLKNVSELKKVKKDIARIMTVLSNQKSDGRPDGQAPENQQ